MLLQHFYLLVNRLVCMPCHLVDPLAEGLRQCLLCPVSSAQFAGSSGDRLAQRGVCMPRAGQYAFDQLGDFLFESNHLTSDSFTVSEPTVALVMVDLHVTYQRNHTDF